jgi:hypothetical protein
VPRVAKSDELVLRVNLSCSRVYDGCHTSFDKLLLAENPAAYASELLATDVRGTYQYHVDEALADSMQLLWQLSAKLERFPFASPTCSPQPRIHGLQIIGVFPSRGAPSVHSLEA